MEHRYITISSNCNGLSFIILKTKLSHSTKSSCCTTYLPTVWIMQWLFLQFTGAEYRLPHLTIKPVSRKWPSSPIDTLFIKISSIVLQNSTRDTLWRNKTVDSSRFVGKTPSVCLDVFRHKFLAEESEASWLLNITLRCAVLGAPGAISVRPTPGSNWRI